MSLKITRYPLLKKYIPALTAVILVVLIGMLGTNRMLNEFRSGPPETGKRTGLGELVGTAQVCQTFVAEYAQLAQVEVVFSTFDRQNVGTLTFVLRTSSDVPNDIVTIAQDISLLKNLEYYSFSFPPIVDSAGKTYAFCLEAPGVDLASSVTPLGIKHDTYPDGQVTFRDMWGEEAGVRDLDFRVGYTWSFSQKLLVLSDQLTRQKPFLLGNWGFYAFLIITYLILLYILFFELDQFMSRGRDDSLTHQD